MLADNPSVLPRFLAPDLHGGERAITLDQEETHHLVHVLRLRRGERARVFDGDGHEWEGLVSSLDKRGAVIDELRPVTPLPEPRVRVTLFAAMLRGPAMDALVRDAAMLGASAIVPVFTEHCSVSRKASATPHHADRWRRLAVAGSKQSGRSVVPAIGTPEPLDVALSRCRHGVRLLLVEPTASAGTVGRIDELGARARREGATLAMGPEGGWAPGEIRHAMEAGFRAWSLGHQVLRAEAVPVAALSVLRYAWEA